MNLKSIINLSKPSGLLILCLCLFVQTLGLHDALAMDTASDQWLKDANLKKEAESILEMKGTVPCQWRVIWTKDPSSKAGVSWSTREAGTQHTVYFDTKSHQGKLDDYGQRIKAYKSGAYHRGKRDRDGGVEESFYHHARLERLKPSTRYYFVIQSDDQVSREFYFITAPADDRQFSFISSGDSRSDHTMRCRMNLMLRHLIEKNKGLLAFAHGGDYVFSGKRWGHWTKWLSHNELCVADDGRILPIIPTRGNHDYGENFNEIFDWPGGKDNYYTTRLGKTLSLITLNTEISSSGEQYTWLKKTLPIEREDNRWLISQYHRPLYPAVKKPATAKRFWVPLFEKYNLDFALESDGHALKRTLPIRGEKHDQTGVVYLGEGGLGVPQRQARAERWFFKKPGFATSSHHLILLDVSNEQIRSRFLSPELKVVDDYSFTPRK